MKRIALTCALVLALSNPLMAEGDERKRPSFEEMVQKVAAHLMEKHPDLTEEEALRKASQFVKNKMDDHKKKDERKRGMHEKFKKLVAEIMEKHPDLTEEQAKEKAKAWLKEHHQRRKDRREGDESDENNKHKKFKAFVRKLMEEGLSKEEAIAKAKRIIHARNGDHDGDGEKNKDEIRNKLQHLMKRLKEENPDLTEAELKEKAKAILKRKMKAHHEDEAKARRTQMHALAKKLKDEGYTEEEIHKILREKFGDHKKRDGEGDREGHRRGHGHDHGNHGDGDGAED